MGLADSEFFREILDMANAPLYYEELDHICYNCGKHMHPEDVYKTRDLLDFCSHQCYSTVFNAEGEDDAE